MSTSGIHAYAGTPWPSDVFLSLLDRPEHDELWTIGRPRRHRAGDRIAEQFARPDSVAVVLTGYVKTVRAARAGSRPMMVALSGPGDLLGAEAHWTGKPRHAGHVSSKDGDVLVVGREAFTAFLENPAAHRAFTDVVVRRTVLRDASLSFATHKVNIRLLAFLARMEALYGERTERGVLLDLGLNCDDVSSAIGASIPAVTKALKELKDDGVLTVHPRKVLIHENLKRVLDRACEAEADEVQR
ncbi:Crp/Fnr family transcriptional regulator [Umezawaea endophytica]|uniref:Crp/Fnr family transcriptional regulator n=1 Tax=Umezawaea endophytica TaxID=1654476 RepID=A0A9X2VJ14_9PSEU|nr:Crp/Fnr family transcriptional regulator [Umezawaea endophytica]MCS7477531.1 Crp/Fnr family transcriptional regulator [Umezawaea endophytica]